MEVDDLLISHNQHNQYHGWWWPRVVRSQGISIYDIDIAIPTVCNSRLYTYVGYYFFTNKRVLSWTDTTATVLKMTSMIFHSCRYWDCIKYISRNMHTVFALLCFVVVINWLIFPYPSGLLHWHCGNLTIAPAKQPWWIWINTSCEFIMNDCITTTKQSTTKPCAYFLGYTVHSNKLEIKVQVPDWL